MERKKDDMTISARNQIVGTIEGIKEGAVNGVVAVKVGDQTVKADITMEAINELGLTPGMKVAIIIKATNVMFASGDARITNISARNQFVGTVSKVERGAVNGHVALTFGSALIKGSITNEAIDELGLAEGKPAVAIVKSTDVMIATL
jgi:molybdate transport system regulatory protein